MKNKLSFRIEGQIKFFTDKVKLKEFIITAPLLYEMLKELIQEKDQNHEQQNGKKKIQIYQQLNLKKKLSKQEQRQNHGYREGFDVCQMGGCVGERVERWGH